VRVACAEALLLLSECGGTCHAMYDMRLPAQHATYTCHRTCRMHLQAAYHWRRCFCCFSAEAALSKQLARTGLEAVLHAVHRTEQAVRRMPHLACLTSHAARRSVVSRDTRFAPRSHRAPQMDEHFLKHVGGRAAVEAALRGPANLALLAATVRPDGQAVRSAPRIRDRGVRDTVAFGIPWRSYG
jgi:hypothetical protein